MFLKHFTLCTIISLGAAVPYHWKNISIARVYTKTKTFGWAKAIACAIDCQGSQHVHVCTTCTLQSIMWPRLLFYYRWDKAGMRKPGQGNMAPLMHLLHTHTFPLISAHRSSSWLTSEQCCPMSERTVETKFLSYIVPFTPCCFRAESRENT